MGKGGGNVAFQCNFCKQIYKGSYYRVKAHLLKIKGVGVASCTKVTNENLVEMPRMMEEAEQRVKHIISSKFLYPHQALQHLILKILLLVLVLVLVLVLLIQKGERGLLDQLRRHSIWVHVK